LSGTVQRREGDTPEVRTHLPQRLHPRLGGQAVELSDMQIKAMIQYLFIAFVGFICQSNTDYPLFV
jgi:hypothetical protein